MAVRVRQGLAGLFRCARIRISKYACGGGLGAGRDRDQRAVHGSIDHLFCHPWQNITVDWTGILRYSNPLPKSQTRQAPCRTLTDATLWRAGALQIFCEDFGAGPLQCRGRAVQRANLFETLAGN